ncbi:MAG: endonuclease/exonuclease/phosphatase family protein [Sphingobacteriaceae bacterium]|nr:MAG: endonuclease/exonuclease/phosphatase family protein [Sphingobacteriaceae bacterium]
MDLFRRVCYWFVVGCGTLLILITALSLLRTSHWYLEILKFPRLPTLFALVICGILTILLCHKKQLIFMVFIGCLFLAIFLQAWIIYPYMPFAQKTVKSADARMVNSGSDIAILVANVLMSNRNADQLVEIIKGKNPDLILTMEVNRWWVDQLSMLDKNYPYRLMFPTDNTYGMTLYSKHPLSDSKVFFLNNKNVPSFSCIVTLANGKWFRLITVHPVAPKPSEHPDNMGEKENGLLKAAHLVAGQKIPTLVAGDFNDVSWSYNTKKFAGISNLNDVRCGRGMYNTFDAQSDFMKWPLDYVFVSNEFSVIELERLPAFGSDHYPFYAKLALLP